MIGTVNAAKCLFTAGAAVTVHLALGKEIVTTATLGFLAGGVLAAPLGAALARRIRADTLTLLMGLVLLAASLSGLWRLPGR